MATPLGLKFWIGRPASETSPVAQIIMPPVTEATLTSRMSLAARANPTGPTAAFLSNRTGYNVNSTEFHAAEIASANGITNAAGLAALYAPLAMDGDTLSPSC